MGDELEVFREIVAELEQENTLSYEDMAAALCFMAQKERPFPDAKEPEPTRRESREGRERGERRDGERRGGRERSNEGMVRYRVELGRDHGINPGDLVGAIANEGKISGQSIGHIRLFDSCSSVYLPEGIASSVLDVLKDAKIRNRPMALKPWVDDGFPMERRGRREAGRRDSSRGVRREGGRVRPRRGNDGNR